MVKYSHRGVERESEICKMEQASERKGLERQSKGLRLGPGSWKLPAPAALGLLNGVGLTRGASWDCDVVRAPPERLQLLSSLQH